MLRDGTAVYRVLFKLGVMYRARVVRLFDFRSRNVRERRKMAVLITEEFSRESLFDIHE